MPTHSSISSSPLRLWRLDLALSPPPATHCHFIHCLLQPCRPIASTACKISCCTPILSVYCCYIGMYWLLFLLLFALQYSGAIDTQVPTCCTFLTRLLRMHSAAKTWSPTSVSSMLLTLGCHTARMYCNLMINTQPVGGVRPAGSSAGWRGEVRVEAARCMAGSLRTRLTALQLAYIDFLTFTAY